MKDNNTSANDILKGAKGELQDVVVMGWDKDENLYFNGNVAEGRDLIWLLTVVKEIVMEKYMDDSD